MGSSELELYKQEVPLCKEHKPSGGFRGGCVICIGLKLQSILSAIDYAIGEPNDMEVSFYDVDYNEDAVLERFKKFVQQMKIRKEPES